MSRPEAAALSAPWRAFPQAEIMTIALLSCPSSSLSTQHTLNSVVLTLHLDRSVCVAAQKHRPVLQYLQDPPEHVRLAENDPSGASAHHGHGILRGET